MNKLLFPFLLLILFMGGCSSDIDDKFDGIEGSVDASYKMRAYFSSTEDYFTTLTFLSQLRKEELYQWAEEKGYKTIFGSENISDLSITEASFPFQVLFNENLELQIADSIIWYNEGNLYYLNGNKDIQQQKQDKTNLHVVGSIIVEGISPIDETDQVQTRGTLQVGNWDKNSNISHKFKKNSKTTLKYIDQLEANYITINGKGRAQLMLATYFYYKKNSSWKEATSELQRIVMDIQGTLENQPYSRYIDAFKLTGHNKHLLYECPADNKNFTFWYTLTAKIDHIEITGIDAKYQDDARFKYTRHW